MARGGACGQAAMSLPMLAPIKGALCVVGTMVRVCRYSTLLKPKPPYSTRIHPDTP